MTVSRGTLEVHCSLGHPTPDALPDDHGGSHGRWLASQNCLLEMIAARAPLKQVLESLVHHLEAESDDAMCSILLVRDGRLWTGAAPSLPASYNDAIHGLAYGPCVGSCGNTAFTGEPTIIEDITVHPYWANYRELARRAGLRSCWSTPIKSADHKVVGTFAIYRAIPGGPTERDWALIRGATHLAGIAIERQLIDDVLREQAQALHDADRRKDIFLAALSHELRNPIAPILTAVQLLERTVDMASASRLSRGLQVIERQTYHLMGLIDDLLDLARVREGKIVLHSQKVAVADLVQQAIAQMANVIEQRGHKLHVELPAEPILIYADPVRVVQVLVNLLSNAAKYTQPGGEIWITVSTRDRNVQLAVRDSGIGIAPEQLHRIFDLYAQVDQPRAGMPGGLGIGLALVKNLVTKHGGAVLATSPGINRGSEFRVSLPLLLPEEKAETSQAPGASPPQVPQKLARRVLVVDDNEAAAETIGTALETIGCTVKLANCGKDALAAADTWDPDVIFLDIGLPDLSGWEIARYLRTRSKRRQRLIALTGYGQPSDVSRAAAAGFDQLLTKPAELDAILAAVTPT